ncbi:hypothetical protein NPIL_329341 [Nephila pilipes]|uniref:Uncharacterized protein n=2 Tax=Nephila pilipes TaxID=299642 RepID=A0A8X6P0X4_NEPPI|nr:hypothetical protein NPIL_329341 [Nephila pilipes]
MQSALLLRLVLRTQVISRRSLSHLSGDSDERGRRLLSVKSHGVAGSVDRPLCDITKLMEWIAKQKGTAPSQV